MDTALESGLSIIVCRNHAQEALVRKLHEVCESGHRATAWYILEAYRLGWRESGGNRDFLDSCVPLYEELWKN